MDLRAVGSLIISIAVPLGASSFESIVVNGGDNDWYKQLKRPSWTPPSWAFPVVWTILYILMGFRGQTFPLTTYAVQLVLNLLWTPFFFGFHQIGLAFFEIILLWVAIAVTIYLFWPVNTLAAYLLIPYLGWVSLASTLNYSIWVNNDFSSIKQL